MTIPELVNMLVTTEETLKSSKGTVLAVERTSLTRRKFGWKKKIKSAKKQKKESKSKKNISKKAEAKGKYFHCDA